MIDENETPPAPPTLPPTEQTAAGSQITIDRAEFDRLQAESRRATKALHVKEAADAARAAKEAADAAAAAGEFNKALEIERAERAKLNDQLTLRDRKDQLRDEILGRNFTGSQARILARLVDVASDDFDPVTAVDTAVAEYPDLFTGAPTAPPPPDLMRRGGPVPPARPGNVPFEGYISPEEYPRFPHRVRISPQFQQRVAASRIYWPTTFNAGELPRGNE